MQRALAKTLEWKGRAISAGPALKAAKHAIESLDYLQCPWCNEAFSCDPGCLRVVTLKILNDALPPEPTI